MINNSNELTKKCLVIKNVFNLDVQVLNEDLKPIFHLSEDTAPSIIAETRKQIAPYFQKALQGAKKQSFCFYTDSFHLSYIGIGMQEDDSFKRIILLGPFLVDKVTEQWLWKVLTTNHLEQKWLKPLKDYYKTLPYAGDNYTTLGENLVNLYTNPYSASTMIYIKDRVEPVREVLPPQNYDQEGGNIRMRYEAEKTCLHFIETGEKEKALESLADYTGDFLYRVPGNPIRAKKNLTFSCNSMYRITAARGGVPPQYLHDISEKYSYKIEKAVTLAELNALEISMIEEYCDAVKKYAIKGHSPVVKKALMYMDLHFHEPNNLQSVADKIGFNRTYLAKKFKEEMNISVIDYLQKKRIKEAAFLIEQGKSSITDISHLVGFSSYNYFCKVFKEEMGMTATAYKKENA